MKLGIGSYTFGWAVGVRGYDPPRPLDEAGLLDWARGQGVRVVQIGDNLPLVRFDAARLDRLAARAAEAGIALEVGARGLTPENLAAYAEIARRLHASILRFVIDEEGYQPPPDQVTALLRDALPGLQDGPTVALENHDRFTARVLRAIVEGVDSERVGVCLDTANSLGAGEGLGEVTDVLGPLTVNLHIKDFTIARLPHQMGFTIEGRPAGQGMVDLPALLERLAPWGRCHSAILELWTPPEATLGATLAKEAAWAAESLDYLRPLFDS